MSLGRQHVWNSLRAVFAALTLLASAGVGQETLTEEQRKELLTERDRLRLQVSSLQKAGKIREAIAAVEQIIAIQQRSLGDTNGTADWWLWIGQHQERMGDIAAAKRSRQQAMEMKTRLFGAEHWMVKDVRVLLETGEILARLSAANQKRLHEADRLVEQADQLQEDGKYRQAIPLIEQAMNIRRTLLGPQHPHYGQTLSYLGALHSELAQYSEAQRFHERTVEITKVSLGERHPNYTYSLNNLAEVYLAQARCDLAEPLYQKAVQIEKEILGEEHPSYATGLNNLAALYLRTGEMTKAVPLSEEVLKIKERSLGKEHRDYALALYNLAIMYGEAGDYARAEPGFRQAAEITAKALGQQHPDYAHRLHGLAQCYDRMGDLSRAEPIFHRVLELRRQTLGENHPDFAAVLMDLGDLWYQAKAYKSAEKVYRQALEIRKQVLGQRHPDYAYSLSALARTMKFTGEQASAEALHRTVLSIQREAFGEDHPVYASALQALAANYMLQGDFRNAHPLLVQAVDIAKKSAASDSHNLAVNLSELAVCYQWMGEPEKALTYFRESLEINRKKLQEAAVVQSERQQLAMLIDNRVSLDSFLCLVINTPQYCREALDEVLAWQGAVQSRQRAIRAVSGHPEMVPILQDLRTTVSRLAALSIANPAAQQSASWKAQFAELSEKEELLEARLAAVSQEYRQATAPFSVADLQAGLPADSALVEYFECLYVEPKGEGGGVRSEYRLIAFVVRPKKEVQLIDLGAVQPLADAIEAWRKSLDNAQCLESTGRQLRDKLWGPMEAHLAGAKTILISPYRNLAMLPFGALPGRASGTFLIEEYALAVVPSPQAVTWTSAEERADSVPEMLIVGDVDYDRATSAGQRHSIAARAAPLTDSAIVQGRAPRDEQSAAFSRLPGTAGELTAIAALYEGHYTGKAKVLKGAEASEINLVASADRPRYLHLATHGYFAAERFKSAMSRDFSISRSSDIKLTTHQSVGRYHPGLLCGLALAGANQPTEGDDGILTAAEVSSLNLSNVELIVLSACETGLGNFSGSDGMLGLQRAFQVAGAQSVVASLWSVPDQATKTLMVRFYENLWKKKMEKLEALREAQLWMLNQGAEQPEIRRDLDARGLTRLKPDGTKDARLPPYYWAAWVLSGNWR